MPETDPTITVYLLSSRYFGALHKANWLGILDNQDTTRVERARSKRRNEFLLSRMLLRYALSRNLDEVNPATLEVLEKTEGQPVVAEADRSNIRFNISHSHDYAAVAVSTDCGHSIGVDIEYVRNPRSIKDIASAFCSESELTEISSGNESSDSEILMYMLWTRKEAALKSRGLGIGEVPLQQIGFRPRPSVSLSQANKQHVVVTGGMFDDYSLSVATSQLFKLAVEEISFDPANNTINSQPLETGAFTTWYTRF